jgi:hypothetical protein
MSNGSNVPISVTITNGYVAIAGKSTGTLPPIPLPGFVKAGILGTSDDGTGIYGSSHTGPGVTGESIDDRPWAEGKRYGPSDGVLGVSAKNGVHGRSFSSSDSGVWGENSGGGYGVSGSTQGSFVPGPGGTAGVWGHNSGTGTGVKGTSSGGDGVLGYSSSNAHAGVSAVNDSRGFGVWASGTPAGHFEGDVEVTGNVRVNGDVVLANQDCAEDFAIAALENVGPGSVMVIGHDGALRQSGQAYDKTVAGVISGAGDFKPGIVLGRQQSLDQSDRRVPIALMGRTYCKVDAGSSPIEVGDLLTTSSIPGHAMKAADPLKAFGAVIGKALVSLKSGQGLIPILIALQ